MAYFGPDRVPRPILIDGQNVALYRGLMDPALCLLPVNYFRKRGHETHIIFPRKIHFGRCNDMESQLLQKYTVLTPARVIEGVNEVSNDDLFLLRHALDLGACIVSNDQFRTEYKQYSEFRDVIRYRTLQYTIIGSSFHVAEDPLGKNTTTNLDEILYFPLGEAPPTRSDVVQELLADTPDVAAMIASGNLIADFGSTDSTSRGTVRNLVEDSAGASAAAARTAANSVDSFGRNEQSTGRGFSSAVSSTTTGSTNASSAGNFDAFGRSRQWPNRDLTDFVSTTAGATTAASTTDDLDIFTRMQSTPVLNISNPTPGGSASNSRPSVSGQNHSRFASSDLQNPTDDNLEYLLAQPTLPPPSTSANFSGQNRPSSEFGASRISRWDSPWDATAVLGQKESDKDNPINLLTQPQFSASQDSQDPFASSKDPKKITERDKQLLDQVKFLARELRVMGTMSPQMHRGDNTAGFDAPGASAATRSPVVIAGSVPKYVLVDAPAAAPARPARALSGQFGPGGGGAVPRTAPLTTSAPNASSRSTFVAPTQPQPRASTSNFTRISTATGPHGSQITVPKRSPTTTRKAISDIGALANRGSPNGSKSGRIPAELTARVSARTAPSSAGPSSGPETTAAPSPTLSQPTNPGIVTPNTSAGAPPMGYRPNPILETSSPDPPPDYGALLTPEYTNEAIKELRQQVPNTSDTECRRALDQKGGSVTDAVKDLKINQLVELGLCDTGEAFSALDSVGWNLDDAATLLIDGVFK